MPGDVRDDPRSARRRWVAGILAGVLASIGAALAPPAHAQFLDGPAYAFPVPDYGSQLIADAAIEAAKRGGDGQHGRKGHAKRQKRPTARQRATLRFRPSEQVTREFDQRLIEAFDLSDPSLLQRLLDAGRREFRAMLTAKPDPWDPNNAGDVAAGVIVLGYREVNGKVSVPRAGRRALRQVVHDALASSPRIRRQSDAEQQEYAEGILQMAMLHSGGIHLALQSGDAAAVAERREGMRAWIEDILGLDVAEIELTKRGFDAG